MKIGLLFAQLALTVVTSTAEVTSITSPYSIELDRRVTQLEHSDDMVRLKAVERLSAMREFSVHHRVVKLLSDKNPAVRREAAMYLGWVGNRQHLSSLSNALSDDDWTVRQAAITAIRTVTALKVSFEAIAPPSERAKQMESIKNQLQNMNWEVHLAQLLRRAENLDEQYFKRCDALRALARLSPKNAVMIKSLVTLLEPHFSKDLTLGRHQLQKEFYTDPGPNAVHRAEKHFVQAGIRALGCLGQAGGPAEACLIQLLDRPQWAGYAMEAMLDCGGDRSVTALISHLPAFGFDPQKRGSVESNYKGVVKVFPHQDNSGFSMYDRVPSLYFHALNALARLPMSRGHLQQLRKIGPTLVAGIPNAYDATVVYQREPIHHMTAYLLEKTELRQLAVDAAFIALGFDRQFPEKFEHAAIFTKLAGDFLQFADARHPPYAGGILAALCTKSSDEADLISLLDHKNGWLRIDAARALISLQSKSAVPVIRKLLSQAPDDASFGVSMDYDRFSSNKAGQGYDEFNDPSPRFKEAWIMALAHLGDDSDIPLFERFIFNENNVLEIQHAAAKALCMHTSSKALGILQRVEVAHPYFSIRITAREALWRAKVKPISKASHTYVKPKVKPKQTSSVSRDETQPISYAFIKGPHDMKHQFQISKDQTAYSTTDSGPTYRFGHNLFIYNPSAEGKQGTIKQLTHFKSSHVSDLEVSYDGKWLLFSHRQHGQGDPWWHIYEIRRDGSGLRQLTSGPYHDVQAVYLPDGRIAFSSTRLGYRDEYHGYLSTGLTTMNRDGSDIRVIGFNFGRDSEPSVASDGRIIFTRLELFYSRMKTEWSLLASFPDGSNTRTLYGPERRKLFATMKGATAISPPRHRALRITQPQPFGPQQFIINSFQGPMIVGPGQSRERLIMPNNDWAVTCPYPLSSNELLVSAGKRPVKGPMPLMQAVDHGIYKLNVQTGKLSLIYNDPKTAELDARPLRPRPREKQLPSQDSTVHSSFTGVMACNSIFNSRKEQIKQRGRYIRVNEGIPTTARHQTHMNGGLAWRNHGGAIGRILGTIPVADDGSFSVKIPADRMVHLQVLDSDRKVVGNETLWQYVRPNKISSCIGCHEAPDNAPLQRRKYPLAFGKEPVSLMPTTDDIMYRAKLWYKGWTPDEREERIRTTNAINSYNRE